MTPWENVAWALWAFGTGGWCVLTLIDLLPQVLPSSLSLSARWFALWKPLVWLGIFKEEPPAPVLPPPPAAISALPELGPVTRSVESQLAHLEREDIARFHALHGSLFNVFTWGKA